MVNNFSGFLVNNFPFSLIRQVFIINWGNTSFITSLNCKTTTFRVIVNHSKYKQTTAVSHLHISWLNFDKTNHSFLHPSRLWGNRFSKRSAWSFEWGTGAWVKMHRFNVFYRNADTINWKRFPTHGGIYKLEKIQQAFWREIQL